MTDRHEGIRLLQARRAPCRPAPSWYRQIAVGVLHRQHDLIGLGVGIQRHHIGNSCYVRSRNLCLPSGRASPRLVVHVVLATFPYVAKPSPRTTFESHRDGWIVRSACCHRPRDRRTPRRAVPHVQPRLAAGVVTPRRMRSLRGSDASEVKVGLSLEPNPLGALTLDSPDQVAPFHIW